MLVDVVRETTFQELYRHIGFPIVFVSTTKTYIIMATCCTSIMDVDRL